MTSGNLQVLYDNQHGPPKKNIKWFVAMRFIFPRVHLELCGGVNVLYFHPYLGKLSILTNIFEVGGSTTNYRGSMLVFNLWVIQ